jgi:hypothetical protein
MVRKGHHATEDAMVYKSERNVVTFSIIPGSVRTDRDPPRDEHGLIDFGYANAADVSTPGANEDGGPRQCSAIDVAARVLDIDRDELRIVTWHFVDGNSVPDGAIGSFRVRSADPRCFVVRRSLADLEAHQDGMAGGVGTDDPV